MVHQSRSEVRSQKIKSLASKSKSGSLVKRLRHRPLTPVTWVRFPYESPKRKRLKKDKEKYCIEKRNVVQ